MGAEGKGRHGKAGLKAEQSAEARDWHLLSGQGFPPQGSQNESVLPELALFTREPGEEGAYREVIVSIIAKHFLYDIRFSGHDLITS